MAKNQRRTRRTRRNRKQRGGSPTFAYTGDFIKTAGAPQAIWSHEDPHCVSADSMRPAPMVGGGCGCTGSQLQRGGSSGNGGYSMILSNQNGKMFDGVMPGPCPAPQVGGDAKQLIQSYPSGYGLVHPYNSSNSNFMEYESYGRQCMGGGTRYTKRRNQSRSHKRNRNRSRKHH